MVQLASNVGHDHAFRWCRAHKSLLCDHQQTQPANTANSHHTTMPRWRLAKRGTKSGNSLCNIYPTFSSIARRAARKVEVWKDFLSRGFSRRRDMDGNQGSAMVINNVCATFHRCNCTKKVNTCMQYCQSRTIINRSQQT